MFKTKNWSKNFIRVMNSSDNIVYCYVVWMYIDEGTVVNLLKNIKNNFLSKKTLDSQPKKLPQKDAKI